MTDPIRRRPAPLVVLLLCAALGVLSGMVWALVSPAGYRATATTYVGEQGVTTLADVAHAATSAEQARDAYADVATSPAVLSGVIADLRLAVTVDQLAARIDVTTPDDEVLIDIAATDSTPTRAAAIANAVARRLAVVVPELAPATSPSAAAPVRLTLVQAASTGTPVSLFSQTVLLGLLGGTGVGAVVVVIASIRRRPPSGGLAAPSMST